MSKKIAKVIWYNEFRCEKYIITGKREKNDNDQFYDNQFMRKLAKLLKKSITSLLAVVVLILLVSAINHQYQLSKEESLFVANGQFVEVNGYQLHLYTIGQGEQTLVFMAGGGTSSPVLDFKSLYSLLSDQYRIVVIEKAGYGFSNVVDVNRDIDSILSDTRMALSKASIEGPFILVPHSMSGIEALYWAQEYPNEVEAIIGLDMSVPESYDSYDVNMPLLTLASLTAKIGITRWISNLSESDAIRHGTLTDHEKEV